MIYSFKDKDSENFFGGKSVAKWRSFAAQIERRLFILDQATCLQDLQGLPSNHLETLKGDRKGQYSIRINMQWRICFKWVKDEVHDVEIVDYH
jgi:proteic killer suppression protein